MQSCRGYCEEFAYITSNIGNGHWDRPNASRCTMCEKYMITPLTKCPCCHSLLSKHPRTKAGKERLRVQ